MQNLIRTSPLSALATLLLLGLAGCVTPPAPTQAAAPPVYPTRERVAAGQTMDLARNEPMGLFGTRALMDDSPGCSTVRMSDGQPIRLGDRQVVPALAAASATCPARNARTNSEYLTLNRAVLLSDGLYASSPSHECFLPNSGGGHCRPAGQ